MKRGILTGKRTAKRSGVSSGFDLLFVLTAVCGVLLLLEAVEGTEVRLWAALPVSAVPAGLLWYVDQKKRGRFWACFGILVFLCFLPAVVPELREQFQALLEVLQGAAQAQEQEITGAAVFLALAVSLAVFLLEIICRTHWPMYLLTTAALLLPAFLGMDPGILTVLLFFCFQTAFWGMNRLTGTDARDCSGQPQRKRPWSRAAAALLPAGIFLTALFAVQLNTEWFYQAAYSAEGFLQRTVKQLSGFSDNPADGTISRGNLYPTGTEQMELRTTQKPGETLYLRGFSGGDYRDGEWQPADEEEVYARMEENTLHWGQWSRWIPGMMEAMYFTMNENTVREERQRPRGLWIDQKTGFREQWYAPYYAATDWGLWEEFEVTRGYGYRYYETEEVDIDWANIPEGFTASRDWYQELQQAYLKEIENVYTEVPEEELSDLVRLCAENPVENTEQATAFILSVLQENAVYTRTPGLFPFNRDPVEYFLFEGKEGYCQHFASAAVLMYRLYRIPARYASGYAVSPSAFVRQEDGTWTASVTDVSAHAWPEIFLEDYGWVPVEVTPSGYSSAAVYPGMDRERLEQLQAAGNWNLDFLQQPENSETTQTEESTSEETSSGSSERAAAWELSGKQILELVWWALLFAVLLLCGYRIYRIRRIASMDVRSLFTEMKKTVQNAGLLKGFDGTEEEFILHLPGVIPGFTDIQARHLLSIVQEEAYGEHPAGRSGEDEVRAMYRQIVTAVCRELPFWKRLWYRYRRCL